MAYRWWILTAIVLFGAGLLLGTRGNVNSLVSQDIASLEELARQLAQLPSWVIFFVILLKNISAIVLSFALSPLFCIFPFLSLTVNGWLIGAVSVQVVQERSLGYLLAGLLPHGVFELPGLILGNAAALSFGVTVLAALFYRERRKDLWPNIKRDLVYLGIAVALFVPAAVIEAFITPRLLR